MTENSTSAAVIPNTISTPAPVDSAGSFPPISATVETVANYQISGNVTTFNASTTPIRIYTNNTTSWTLAQVYHVVAPALPRGTYSSRSKSATLFLSDSDVAAVTAALTAGLYVSIILESPTSSVIKVFIYGETEIVFS
jgi:hypothetical protein